MPTYLHICDECKKEFEDIYSINALMPNVCPNCNCEGKIRRLLYAPSTKVELYGRELVTKLRADGKALAKEARTNETLAANLYGLK